MWKKTVFVYPSIRLKELVTHKNLQPRSGLRPEIRTRDFLITASPRRIIGSTCYLFIDSISVVLVMLCRMGNHTDKECTLTRSLERFNVRLSGQEIHEESVMLDVTMVDIRIANFSNESRKCSVD
jgi:hypothetical protein